MVPPPISPPTLPPPPPHALFASPAVLLPPLPSISASPPSSDVDDPFSRPEPPSSLRPSPFPPVFPWAHIPLDSEWHAVMRDLTDLRFPLSRFPRPAYSQYPVLRECSSFSDVIAVSQQLSTTSSVAEADAEALRLQRDGLVFDMTVVSDNDAAVRRVGIQMALQQASDNIRHVTFHAAPTDSRLLTQVASTGGPLLLHPQQPFVPNMGRGVHPFPFAPQHALAAHCTKEVRSGIVFAISLSTFHAALADTGHPGHLAPLFTQPKLNSPLARMIPFFGDINHPMRRDLLASSITPISTPTTAQVCEIILNARSHFGPDTPLHLFRVDVSDAFHRTRLQYPSILLLAMHLHVHQSDVVLLPLTQRWGEQGSNYWWQSIACTLLSAAHSRLSHLSPLPLANMYVDDYFGCLPPQLAHDEILAFTEDACSRLGTGAVKDEKTISGRTATVLGWLYNTDALTMSLTERSFLKLVCLFFVDTPAVLTFGMSLPLRHLQCLGSLAIRYANAIVHLLPYSRGFHHNLIGIRSTHPETPIRLTRRSIHDIEMWRIALYMCSLDTSWMTIPLRWPTLLQRRPNESLSDRSLRQSAVATIIGYTDACCSHDHGAGFGFVYEGGPSLPSSDFRFWSHHALPQPQRVDAHGSVIDIHINLCEFIAFLCAVYSISHCLRCTHTHLFPHSVPIHIHLWSDNASCLSWLRTHRADSPFHSLLLSIHSLLHMTFNVFVTEGFIPGVRNPYADAASRLHIPHPLLLPSSDIPPVAASTPHSPLRPPDLGTASSPHNPLHRILPSNVLAIGGYHHHNRLPFPTTFIDNILRNAMTLSPATSLHLAAIRIIQDCRPSYLGPHMSE